MNNKTLGTIALIGAPTMLIGTYLESIYPQLAGSWFTGLWGLTYMVPWMGSMLVLQRTGVLGSSRMAKAMPYVLLLTLTIANSSNLINLFAAQHKPSFFMALDLFWPISHLLMIWVGILAIKAGRLTGWQRFVPLAMGLWLPFALTTLWVLGRTPVSLFVGSVGNAVVVLLFAWVMRSLPGQAAQPTGSAASFTPVLH